MAIGVTLTPGMMTSGHPDDVARRFEMGTMLGVSYELY